jgi:excisionase family DNA binding protein
MDSTQVMTIGEVSTYLRIPTSTLYKLTREGAIPAQKLGKQWRYHKDVLDEWLKCNLIAKTDKKD